MKRDLDLWLWLGLVALAVVALLVFWFQAHQEAATYRRLTGRAVTTWDALWVELRVMDCAPRGDSQ